MIYVRICHESQSDQNLTMKQDGFHKNTGKNMKKQCQWYQNIIDTVFSFMTIGLVTSQRVLSITDNNFVYFREKSIPE